MQHKIKRNRDIYNYRHRPRKIMKSVFWVLCAVVIIFVGWSVAQPVMKFIKGEIKPRPDTTSKTSVVSGSVKSNPSKATVGSGSALRGIYLPKSFLSDTASLASTAQNAKNAGINLAVVDLKSESGMLNYTSKLPDAVSGGLFASGAPDAAAAATAIKNAGLTPAARVCCFLDASTSSIIREAAVLYAPNHSSRWRDNSGNFWLNPYSDRAQQYLIDVSKEAVSLGYKVIILDDVLFPSTGSSNAWYGNSSVPRDQQLRNFIANATKQIGAAGGKVIVRFNAPAAIGQASALTGQAQNMYALPSDYVSPDFLPSFLSRSAVQIGTKTILSPDLTPSGTVSAMAQFAATKATGSNLDKVAPFVQAFTNTSLGTGYYKNYTAADVGAEIAAMKSAGIASYILYNPQGLYDYSGIAK